MMTTPKKTKEEVLAQMTADAELARVEFEQINANSDLTTYHAALNLVADWWERWYLKAGHKRLAYILMNKKLNGE